MILLDKKDSVIDEGLTTVVTIGNFDGVHLGHQKLINKCISIAKEEALKSVILSFYPHPRKLRNPDFVFNTILTQAEKVDFLVGTGVDYFRRKEINLDFLCYTSTEFVEKILVNELKAKFVVVGEDFHFGANRVYDINVLKDVCSKFGITTIAVDLKLENGEKISSTTIRKLISEHHVDEVEKYLGKNYVVTGEVVNGKKLGRTIGVPTANVLPENEKLLPPNGVYLSKTTVKGETYFSITNVGNNPTVSDSKLVVETSILDFDEEIYGEFITVELLKFVRGEVKFKNVHALKEQLHSDLAAAKQYFKEL